MTPDSLTVDTDNDHFDNFSEFWARTDPRNFDSDGDQLGDGWEALYSDSFDPLVADDPLGDDDGDSIPNRLEYSANTSPYIQNLDLDRDQMSNQYELEHGLDHDDATDATLDPDQDGLFNLSEYRFGLNPQRRDSDNDGVVDSMELFDKGTNPNNNLNFHDYGLSETLLPDATVSDVIVFPNTFNREIQFTVSSISDLTFTDANGQVQPWAILPLPNETFTLNPDEVASIPITLQSPGAYQGGRIRGDRHLRRGGPRSHLGDTVESDDRPCYPNQHHPRTRVRLSARELRWLSRLT